MTKKFLLLVPLLAIAGIARIALAADPQGAVVATESYSLVTTIPVSNTAGIPLVVKCNRGQCAVQYVNITASSPIDGGVPDPLTQALFRAWKFTPQLVAQDGGLVAQQNPWSRWPQMDTGFVNDAGTAGGEIYTKAGPGGITVSIPVGGFNYTGTAFNIPMASMNGGRLWYTVERLAMPDGGTANVQLTLEGVY